MSPTRPSRSEPVDDIPDGGDFLSAQNVAAGTAARRMVPAWSTWLVLVATVVWVALLLVPVLSHRGWPHNHDSLAPVSRMAALLGQWQAGHWLPVWSTHQQDGLGSPMVILYHKLHMYLSTAILVVTGHVKAALVLPIALFMSTGIGGMVFCLRQFLGPRHRMLQWVVAAMLPATNYASLDWFVRGAAAEFAAMMILPWIFGWCARLLVRGVWQVWIGLAVGLLALAHSTLGMFALLPLGMACALAAVRWRTHVRHWIKPMAVSVCLGLLVVAPFVLPMAAMARFNMIERLSIPPHFVPRMNMVHWTEFFWNAGWHWGDTYEMNYQIDLALLLLSPLLLLFFFRRRPWSGSDEARSASDRRVLSLFLLSTLAVMGWLQTSSAFWVYDVVPGAALLQFSWRLLAFLTVAALVCAGVALAEISDALGARFGRRGFAAGLVLALFATLSTAEAKMWWHKTRFQWFSQEEMAQTLKANEYWANGEFLPKVDWKIGPSLQDAQIQSGEWFRTLPAQGCKVSRSPRDTAGPEKERAVGYWTVDCERAQPAWLRLYLAPGMELHLQRADAPAQPWQRTVPHRTCTDPRVRVDMPAGVTTVRVDFPTWQRASAAVFRRLPFDYRRDCPPAS